MLLEDLFDVVNENMTVIIVDSLTQTELCRYDGKNSIDEQYNECSVMDIVATSENELTIDIDYNEF